MSIMLNYMGGGNRNGIIIILKRFYLTEYYINYMLNRFTCIPFSHIEYLPLQ